MPIPHNFMPSPLSFPLLSCPLDFLPKVSRLCRGKSRGIETNKQSQTSLSFKALFLVLPYERPVLLQVQLQVSILQFHKYPCMGHQGHGTQQGASLKKLRITITSFNSFQSILSLRKQLRLKVSKVIQEKQSFLEYSHSNL